MALRLQEAAALLLDEIFCFTRESWGDAQAERSITDLIRAFLMIDTHGVTSRPLPAEFEVDGSGFRHAQQVIYWKRLANGDIGIVTILRERVHQRARFRDDLAC